MRARSLVLVFLLPALAAGEPCDPSSSDPLADIREIAGHAGSVVMPAIAQLRARVAGLNTEIATLESGNQARRSEVDRLVSEVEQRKRELEQNYERTRTIGMLGILFGVPAVGAVSLVKMWEDDDRLRELSLRLEEHKAERDRIDRELAAYVERKRVAQEQLRALESTEGTLSASLEVTPLALEGELARAAAEHARVQAGRQLVLNLRQQVEILRGLRANAATVGLDLDSLIAELEASADRAEELVAQSDKSLYELVRLATAEDPEAAATAWLENWRSAKTREALRTLGLDARVFVDELIARSFPEGGPAAVVIRSQLLGQLRTAGFDVPSSGATFVTAGAVPFRVSVNDGSIRKIEILWKMRDGSVQAFDMTPRGNGAFEHTVNFERGSPAGAREFTFLAHGEDGTTTELGDGSLVFAPES